MTEICALLGMTLPQEIAGLARRAEADGWDTLYTVDTQNLAGEAVVTMAVVAQQTSRLRFGTWVTNPVTRHPAVLAAAFASLGLISDGRAVLAIGRGDSALAYIGKAPMRIGAFDRYLGTLSAYLAGEGVPFDAIRGWSDAPDIDALTLGDQPRLSRLTWLPQGRPAVPIDVAATGPKAIAAAARHADRITFGLGADPERIGWAIGEARRAAVAAGRDPDSVSLGAGFTLVPHADIVAARRIAKASVASQARFSAIHGQVVGPATASDRAVYEAVSSNYDMTRHGQASTQVDPLTDDFIDRFAVVGSPAQCIDRLHALVALGLDRLVLYPRVPGPRDTPESHAIYETVVGTILPVLRRG